MLRVNKILYLLVFFCPFLFLNYLFILFDIIVYSKVLPPPGHLWTLTLIFCAYPTPDYYQTNRQEKSKTNC